MNSGYSFRECRLIAVGGGVSREYAIGYNPVSRSRPLTTSGTRQHLTRALAYACVCSVCASVRVRAPGRVCAQAGVRVGAGAGVRACVMYM